MNEFFVLLLLERLYSYPFYSLLQVAQTAGTVEYVDFFLYRGVRLPTNECPGYDTKPSDRKAPVLDLWKRWTTFPLLLLPGPLWSEVLGYHQRVK